jgi:exonuclease VII large subunit
MALTLIIAILLAATVGLITHLLTRKQAHLQADALGRELAEFKTALSTAKTDFDARQEELRNSINEARENEAKAKATESEQRYTEVSAELKIALQEKGRFQSEATRVEEVKAKFMEQEFVTSHPFAEI